MSVTFGHMEDRTMSVECVKLLTCEVQLQRCGHRNALVIVDSLASEDRVEVGPRKAGQPQSVRGRSVNDLVRIVDKVVFTPPT